MFHKTAIGAFRATALLLLVAIAIAAGCYFYFFKKSPTAPTSAAPTLPPPQVTVITAQIEPLELWSHFSGRLVAVNKAAIKPRVGGEIQQVLFSDGDSVAANQPLFVIDPRPYQATLAQAKAALAAAESQKKLAYDELNRTRQLIARKLIADNVYDKAKNAYQVAAAAIDGAKSAVAQAQLNVSYTTIKAPFSGQIGRAELTVGNMVDAASSPTLATLVSNRQLYAEFNVDEKSYLSRMRQQEQSPEQSTGPLPVKIKFSGEEKFYQGILHAFDNQLNIATGTIRARAIFNNTDGALTPGMYVDVYLGSTQPAQVILVPDMAIGTNQNNKFVYVVDSENKATYRPVTLGQTHEDKRVVAQGLAPGEQVIINGLPHVRPGITVSPKAHRPDAENAASAKDDTGSASH